MEKILIGLLIFCSAGYLVYILIRPFKEDNCTNRCNNCCNICKSEGNTPKKVKEIR